MTKRHAAGKTMETPAMTLTPARSSTACARAHDACERTATRRPPWRRASGGAMFLMVLLAWSAARPETVTAIANDATTTPWHDRLAGSWVLTSLYDEDESGEEVDQWSYEPYGRLSFDRDGHFALHLKDGLGFDLCVAYAGRYELTQDRELTFHPEAGMNSGREEAVRNADLEWRDGQLHLTSSARRSLSGSFYSHSAWQYMGPEADTAAKPCRRQIVGAQPK
jgi:hypothetical protein